MLTQNVQTCSAGSAPGWLTDAIARNAPVTRLADGKVFRVVALSPADLDRLPRAALTDAVKLTADDGDRLILTVAQVGRQFALDTDTLSGVQTDALVAPASPPAGVPSAAVVATPAPSPIAVVQAAAELFRVAIVAVVPVGPERAAALASARQAAMCAVAGIACEAARSPIAASAIPEAP